MWKTMERKVVSCAAIGLILLVHELHSQAEQRSQADLAREADSVRAAYADSVAHSAPTPPSQTRPELEFRGHRIGDRRWLKNGCWRRDTHEERQLSCNDPKERIGEMWARTEYVFTDDVLTSVLLFYDSFNYELMVRAFATKFGQPDTVITSEGNPPGLCFALLPREFHFSFRSL